MLRTERAECVSHHRVRLLQLGWRRRRVHTLLGHPLQEAHPVRTSTADRTGAICCIFVRGRRAAEDGRPLHSVARQRGGRVSILVVLRRFVL